MRVLLTGGGTGGHVFPALAIAEALRVFDPAIDVQFIGTANGFEARALERAGERMHVISAGGIISKGLVARVVGLSRAALGVWQSARLLRRLQPDVLVGTGGFVMAPVLMAARLRKLPFVLQEQNSYPGYTTRKFAAKAHAVCLGSEAAAQHLPLAKTVSTGNPIRATLVRAAEAANPMKNVGDKFRLLVVGGSLGAKSINMAVADCLNELIEIAHVDWQFGRSGLPDSVTKESLARLAADGKLDARPFFDDMELRYGRADLAICRAGALTLAELALFGLPALLIPFPFAAHQHQLANAREVERAGAAQTLLDHELTGRAVLDIVQTFKSDPAKLASMSKAMQRLARPHAAHDIAEQILSVKKS